MKKELTCYLCNTHLRLDDYVLSNEIPSIMKEKQICYNCAFWHKIKNQDKYYMEECKSPWPLITPHYEHYYLYQNLWAEVGTFQKSPLYSTEQYIAILINDQVHIRECNNWSFQGVIGEHLRELFTPNGIILNYTSNQLSELLDRKLFTSDDLKIMIELERTK